MVASKGFTLIEITVVLIIVGILAAFAVPSLVVSMEQTKAQMARNNLLAISAAQQKYFEDNNSTSYCLVGCGDTTANINTYLHLAISDPFSYTCSASGSSYTCQAGDSTDVLTLNPNAQPPVTCVSASNSNNCPS